MIYYMILKIAKIFLKRSKPYITGNWGEPGTDYLLVQRSVGSISCNGRSRQYIWKSFLHQIILYMTTALLPFPGAEGISEFSFVKLFAGMFSSVPVAAVVLVNRGISFYFLLILSGILGVVLGRFNGRSADQSGTKYKLQQETENGTGKILT